MGRGKEQVTSSKGRGKYSGGRKYKLIVFFLGNLLIRLLIVSVTNFTHRNYRRTKYVS